MSLAVRESAEPARATELSVLLVEDNPADALLIAEALDEPAGPSVALETVDRLGPALARLEDGSVGAVLLDLSLPDSHGLETFRRVHAAAPTVPVVVLSGLADEAVAVQAVREGAQDYLVKGQADGPLLVRALRYAVERRRAEEERARLREAELARAQAEAGERRASFLAEASALLASAFDDQEALAQLARLAVGGFADWCAIDLLEEDGTPRLAAAAHAEAAAEAPLRDAWARGSADPAGPLALALWSGRSALIPAPDDPASPRASFDALGLGSLAVIPLLARDRTLGAVAFGRRPERPPYDQEDMALAEDLARRAALAVDNVRLYRAAQDAIDLRDRLLAAVAHDLKNPLSAISGTVQLMRRREEREGAAADPRRLDGLRRIDTSTRRMLGLIGELLDVALLQMGRPLELERRNTDLVQLARRMAGLHAEATTRHRLSVEAETDELLGVWDEARLMRVVDNLLGNALKYSPNGGDVVVRLSKVDDAEHGGWAVLSVTDHGIGIPAADLPRVFERFHRGANTAGRIAGTGLGLAGVREIVEQHGGSVSVASEEGRGSTFSVRLPLAEPARPAAE